MREVRNNNRHVISPAPSRRHTKQRSAGPPGRHRRSGRQPGAGARRCLQCYTATTRVVQRTSQPPERGVECLLTDDGARAADTVSRGMRQRRTAKTQRS